jgi:hypothetical protein
MALQLFVGLWPLFQFLDLFTQSTGLPGRAISPAARLPPAHRTAQTQNKHRQTSMPRVRFEPTIPVFEPVKTVQPLDREATVISDPKVQHL